MFVHGSVQKVGTKEVWVLSLQKKMPENTYTLIFNYLLINYKECGALNFPVPEDSRSEKSEIELSGTGNFVGLNQPFFLLPFYIK